MRLAKIIFFIICSPLLSTKSESDLLTQWQKKVVTEFTSPAFEARRNEIINGLHGNYPVKVPEFKDICKLLKIWIKQKIETSEQQQNLRRQQLLAHLKSIKANGYPYLDFYTVTESFQLFVDLHEKPAFDFLKEFETHFKPTHEGFESQTYKFCFATSQFLLLPVFETPSIELMNDLFLNQVLIFQVFPINRQRYDYYVTNSLRARMHDIAHAEAIATHFNTLEKIQKAKVIIGKMRKYESPKIPNVAIDLKEVGIFELVHEEQMILYPRWMSTFIYLLDLDSIYVKYIGSMQNVRCLHLKRFNFLKSEPIYRFTLTKPSDEDMLTPQVAFWETIREAFLNTEEGQLEQAKINEILEQTGSFKEISKTFFEGIDQEKIFLDIDC